MNIRRIVVAEDDVLTEVIMKASKSLLKDMAFALHVIGANYETSPIDEFDEEFKLFIDKPRYHFGDLIEESIPTNVKFVNLGKSEEFGNEGMRALLPANAENIKRLEAFRLKTMNDSFMPKSMNPADMF